MWDLSQKCKVFDLTSKSQLLWHDMVVKEWAKNDLIMSTDTGRAFGLFSGERCLWFSEMTLVSRRLKKEGLIGANYQLDLKTECDKYSHIWWQCGLGAVKGGGIYASVGGQLSVSETVYCPLLAVPKDLPLFTSLHTFLDTNPSHNSLTAN